MSEMIDVYIHSLDSGFLQGSLLYFSCVLHYFYETES